MTIPELNVAIMSEPQLGFSFSGKFSIAGHANSFEGSYKAEIVKGKIRLGNASDSLFFGQEVTFMPDIPEQTSFVLNDVTIGVEFHWQQREPQKFRGALKLLIEDRRITAINILPVEDYLVSVISSEMRADSSLSLLKAHAIISRSWLLAQIQKHEGLLAEKKHYTNIFETETEYIRWWDREDHTNYHVCADDHCQRYQGISRAENPNVEKAVRETAGVVLKSGGQIADARYSKCCGGVSEVFESCWEDIHHPYLEKIIDNRTSPEGFQLDLEREESAGQWLRNSPDAFCNTTDREVLQQVLNDYDQTATDFFRWKVEYTQEEISELIQRRSGKDFGKIIDLIPVERGTSGRLTKLKIIGTKQSLTIGKELVIRRWLSESHLYSSAFVIDKVGETDGLPDRFILTGGGWGHGVGLCQIGAAVMGHKGYSHEEILGHYFPKAELSKSY